MIDWVTARVQIQSAVNFRTGEVTSATRDGVVEWVSAKRFNVPGSYSATVSVRSLGNGEVEFSGSPAKFLQGHNVFGSDDLVGVSAEMIERVCRTLNLELSEGERTAIWTGRYSLKRVDINYSFSCGLRTNALAWLTRAATNSTLQNRGTGRLHRGTTMMWGENSRHWMFKAYCKGEELDAKGHKLPDDLPWRSKVAEWADDKLRIELQLLSRELKRLELDRASSWRSETPHDLFQSRKGKLHLGDHAFLDTAGIVQLPRHLLSTYTHWKRGEALMELLPRATFYRQRRQLMAHGINIGAPSRPELKAAVALSQYLEHPCEQAPSWARGTPLFYEPRGDDNVQPGSCITVRQKSGVTRPATHWPSSQSVPYEVPDDLSLSAPDPRLSDPLMVLA